MNAISLIALIGASQGFLLCVVILSIRSGNRLANRFLAAFVLVESIRLLLAFTVYAQIPVYQPIYVLFNVRLAAGPLVFLYVCALTDEHFAPSRKMLVHFTPVLLGFLASIPIVAEGQVGAYQADSPDWFSDSTRSRRVVIQSMLGATVWMVYSFVSLRYLRSHETNIREQFSALERIDLRWLRALILAGLFASAAYIAYDVLRLALQWDAEAKIWGSIVFTIFVVYVITIGGMRQPLIFRPQGPRIPVHPSDDFHSRRDTAHGPVSSRAPVPPRPETTPKYQHSGLHAEQSLALWERLEMLMEEEKPYLQSRLNLRSLAQSLDAIPQDLSQAINTHATMNFYEFINRHRVEAARALLAHPDNRDRSLLDIGLDAGFNSQATFYKHFKKCTGMTPKAYRHRHKESMSSPAT